MLKWSKEVVTNLFLASKVKYAEACKLVTNFDTTTYNLLSAPTRVPLSTAIHLPDGTACGYSSKQWIGTTADSVHKKLSSHNLISRRREQIVFLKLRKLQFNVYGEQKKIRLVCLFPRLLNSDELYYSLSSVQYTDRHHKNMFTYGWQGPIFLAQIYKKRKN